MGVKEDELELAKGCVPEGWRTLVDKIYKAKPKDIEITDIKEKYGVLRVYVASYNDENEWFLDLLDYYEDLSKSMCQICGKPAKIYTDGWYVTMCPEHYEQYSLR